MSDISAQQAPHPIPGDMPVPPPSPGPGRVPDPVIDPDEPTLPMGDPDVVDPGPGPQVPPPMVA